MYHKKSKRTVNTGSQDSPGRREYSPPVSAGPVQCKFRRVGSKEQNIQTGRRPDIRVAGGYDGKNIYMPKDSNSVDAFAHELGHAMHGHMPGNVTDSAVAGNAAYRINRSYEQQADSTGETLRQGLGSSVMNSMMRMVQSIPARTCNYVGRMLPYLTDSWGDRVDPVKLVTLARFRHGDEEGGVISHYISLEQHEVTPKNIYTFINELKDSGTVQDKKAGLLLDLIESRFLTDIGDESNELDGEKAWDAYGKAVRYIKVLGRRYNASNSDINEETPLLGTTKFTFRERDLEYIRSIGQNQWQAASVAGMRAGWLTYQGFLELRDGLKKATKGTGNVVELRITRDVLHVANINDLGYDFGTVTPPEYDDSIADLNKSTGLFRGSGAYSEVKDVIFKSLDLGHQVVDIWENISHRTKGKQVDPEVDFQFLALLSPHPDSQKVIGANGEVLGDGSYMFTIDSHFRIRYMPAANYAGEGGTAKNFFQFIPHSQLASLGVVVAAGNFVIKNGRFVWIDNGSGHYRVNAGVNEKNAKVALENIGYDTSGILFLNRAGGDLDEIYRAGNAVLTGLPEGEHRPVMTPEIISMQKAMMRFL